MNEETTNETTAEQIETKLATLPPATIARFLRRYVQRYRPTQTQDSPIAQCIGLWQESATSAYWRVAWRAMRSEELRGRSVTVILCDAEQAADMAAEQEWVRQLRALEIMGGVSE